MKINQNSLNYFNRLEMFFNISLKIGCYEINFDRFPPLQCQICI